MHPSPREHHPNDPRTLSHQSAPPGPATPEEQAIAPLVLDVLHRLSRANDMIAEGLRSFPADPPYAAWCTSSLVLLWGERPEDIDTLLFLRQAGDQREFAYVPEAAPSSASYCLLGPLGLPTHPRAPGHTPPEPLLRLAEIHSGLGDLRAAMAVAEQLLDQRFAWRVHVSLARPRIASGLRDHVILLWRNGEVIGEITHENNFYLDERHVRRLRDATWTREVFV